MSITAPFEPTDCTCPACSCPIQYRIPSFDRRRLCKHKIVRRALATPGAAIAESVTAERLAQARAETEENS